MVWGIPNLPFKKERIFLDDAKSVFKNIQVINDDPEKTQEDKKTDIIKLLHDNKSVFEKKGFMGDKSIIEKIAIYNTSCEVKLPIADTKFKSIISKKINYLANHPELTYLMGKTLGEIVKNDLHPMKLMDNDDDCTPLQGEDECYQENYNRNLIICKLQQGATNTPTYNTPQCEKASKCTPPASAGGKKKASRRKSKRQKSKRQKSKRRTTTRKK